MNKEYTIMDTSVMRNRAKIEKELNELAKEGWRLVASTDHYLYLERDARVQELLTEG